MSALLIGQANNYALHTFMNNSNPILQSPESKNRRSHSERREEAEERMLRAAVNIVAERGLENLTLAECGEAAGYSRGLAAHYFNSKEGLITAIATHIVEEYSQRLRADRRIRVGLSGLLESVAFYIDSGRAHIVALRAFHAVLGAALNLPALSSAIAELNRNTVSYFALMLKSGIEHGEVRPNIDIHAQAVIIISSLRGVMTQWLLDPDHVDLDAIKKELLIDLRRLLTT
jgi:AcrR family transcriptional regulator